MTHSNQDSPVEIEIDRNSPLPLYFQVKQMILKRIEEENAQPGSSLPGEKDFEEQYGVSRITIRRALQELVDEGYIVRQPGKGSFVRQAKLQDRSAVLGGFAYDLRAQGYEVESEILEYSVQPAATHIAEKLGIGIGKDLLYFKRLVIADGEPIAVTNAHFNVDSHVAFSRKELSMDSIFPLFERKYGIVLRRAQKSIEVTLTLKDEADLLGVAPNSPAMLTELLVFNEQEETVGFVKTLYRGDRYKYFIMVTR